MDNLRLNLPGKIIVLNGAPRTGKSSISKVVWEAFDGVWMSMGVDSAIAMVSVRQQPALGLRPGGEWPDLEPLAEALYLCLYASMASHARRGIIAIAGNNQNGFSPNAIVQLRLRLSKSWRHSDES